MKKILITGMSGLIGGMAGCHLLGKGYQIRSLNRRTVSGVESFQGDIKDLDQILPAFEGIDIVVHLAAYLGEEWQDHLDTNIIGSYNVFEAAKRSGIKNIIFGSSGATQKYYENEDPIKSITKANWDKARDMDPLILTHLDPPRPDNIYGASKVWGETLGRLYSDEQGMSVICIRIGRVTKDNIPVDARHAAVYCSHRDINQIIEKSVCKIEKIKFEIIYAVSNNKGRFRDISKAKEVVGYEPQDGIKEWPLKDL